MGDNLMSTLLVDGINDADGGGPKATLPTSGGSAFTLGPNWGAMEFVSKTAIAAATNIDITSLAAGYNYVFRINSGVPATDGTNLRIKFLRSSSPLEGSSDYRYVGTSAAYINVAGDIGNVSQVEGISCDVWLPEPNGGSLVKRVWLLGSHSNDNGTSNENTYAAQGKLTSTNPANAIDGIRFYWSSGDWRNEGFVSVFRGRLS